MTQLIKKMKKIIIPLTLSLTVIGVSSALISSIVNNKTIVSYDSSNFNNSESKSNSRAQSGAWQTNTNNVATTSVNVINQDINKNNAFDPSLSQQDYASDISNSGFAMFTSSNGTNGNFDQITKFTTKSQLESFGENKTISPGNVQWIVQSRDFATVLQVAATDIQLKSVIYSPGGFGAHPSAFVIVNCTSTDLTKVGSYIFRIMWNAASTTIGEELVPPKPGDFKLFKRVTDNSSFYDFMVLESPSTNTIQILRTPMLTSSGNLSFDFKQTSEADSKNPMTISPLSRSYILDRTLMGSNFTTNAIPKQVWYLNSIIYVFYQDKTSTSADSSKAGTWVKLPPFSGATTFNLTQNDLLKLNLDSFYSSGVFQNIPSSSLIYKLINIKDDNYKFLISQSSGTASPNNSSRFVSITFSLTTLFENNTGYISDTHTSLGTNIYFKTIQKMYGGVNNAFVDSYLVLDNLERTIKFDQNFSNPSILYNFKQASVDLGNIAFIYTQVGDSNWYALMKDGKFAQFSNSLLIGRWDVVSSQPSIEMAANFEILNFEEINPFIIYQKIANDQNNGYSNEFNRYLQNSTSYDDFMDITFIDPRLNDSLPLISISASAFVNSTNRIYDITLTFTQTLRSLNPNGSINVGGTSSSYELFSQNYQFINEEASIYGAIGSVSSGSNHVPNIPFSAPSFIKNKFPSEITEEEVRTYLIKDSNAPNFLVSRNPSDLYGILDVTVNVPIMWKSNGAGSYFVVQNEVINFNFGSQQEAFFNSNPLFGQNTSIVQVDESYASLNQELIETLTLKYSATLPSSANLTNVISDFVILGSAFTNQSLINNGLIVLPERKDIILVPLDKDGQILVSITFPKIGNDLNKKILFFTPKVFLRNPTANEAIYFSFKNNEDALNTNFGNTTNKLSSYSPSHFVSLLNGYNNPSVVQAILSYFAVYSSYFNNLINQTAESGENVININAKADDIAGTLDIQIELQSTLPNSNIYRFDKIFSGFKKTGTPSTFLPSFRFNNIPSNLLSSSPSNITNSELINNNVLVMNDIASSLQYSINLEPINTSGILGVTVTFNNWTELNGNINVVLPTKEFSRYFSGFAITKPPTSVMVWKSYSEIEQKYQNAFPTFVVNSIKSSNPTNLSQLLQFANVSESIKSYLKSNDSQLSLSYIPNDLNGSISIIAKITGYLSPTNIVIMENKISGFNYIYSDAKIVFEDANSIKLDSLRNKLPSDISDEEISALYSISFPANSPTIEPSVTIVKNNIKGTLSIVIELKDPSTNIVKQSMPIIYYGFSVLQPQKSTIDYLVVVLSVIIPLIIIVPPIIFISVFKNKKEIKRISELLDKRLTDIDKKNSKKTDVK